MINPAVDGLAEHVGTAAACALLGRSRASHYRAKNPPPPRPRTPRPAPANKLSAAERAHVLAVLTSQRFADKSVAQVWATLLDEGTYLCSMSTMHRILREHDMAGERRRQASHPPRTRPELVATAPGQVWSWDITKLKGPERGVYYDLYVVLDIFSRFVVGWGGWQAGYDAPAACWLELTHLYPGLVVDTIGHTPGAERNLLDVYLRTGPTAEAGPAGPDTVTADLAPGQSAVYVAVDGAFAGVLLLADRIRPESAATVQALHRLGARQVLMLTGDAEATGRHIAGEAGIDEVHADLLPADKVRLLSERPERPVMMVGDGVNDVPVLAAADVGVAMGARGSTAASESADVVVLADDVSKVAVAVAAGQRTLQVATQSIWVGIALSLVLMVIAATGAIPALVGALFQELVDVVAIVNALRAMKPGPHEAERLGDLAAAPARGERQAVSA